YLNLSLFAWTQTRLGQHDAAAEALARAGRIGKEIGQQLLWSDTTLMVRAELAFNRGQHAEAVGLAAETVAAAAQCGGVFSAGLAHRVWAQSLCALGASNWQEVAEHLSASLDALTSGQAVIEAARTHAVWGNLCCMYGHDVEARRHLMAACERFTQSGLDAELAAVQAALRTLPEEPVQSLI